MTWLARYILPENLKRYRAAGWRYWCRGPTLGGWATIIVRKRDFPPREKG